MKLLSKDESKRILGRKKGFFGQGMSLDSVPIFYIGGISEIDDDLASRGIELKDQMTMFNAYPNGFEIEVYTLPTKNRLGTRTYRIPIMPSQLLKWTIEKQDAVYEQQSKSVLGKAVIGGLLFGGAGAVVGALSGTKGKREKVNFIDYVLTLIINYNGEEKAIVLGFPNAIIKDVRKFFDKSFPNTLSVIYLLTLVLKHATKSYTITLVVIKSKQNEKINFNHSNVINNINKLFFSIWS